ncbi:MAG: hypothetical protein GF372_12385, partial [Candidatus Marinimicrobia bacterium]|nr:hypothetical protein [Candidatus Neomarinimicrobiota bacterium]
SHLNGIKTKSYEDALKQVKSEITGASEVNYPFKWFNNELKPTLGIDVLNEDFDRDDGYAIITKGNISVLILQTEKLDTLFPTVISDFIGSRIAPVKARVRKNPIYSKLKKNLNFQDSFLERTYNQPGMKHFYSDKDIDKFISRWGKS